MDIRAFYSSRYRVIFMECPICGKSIYLTTINNSWDFTENDFLKINCCGSYLDKSNIYGDEVITRLSGSSFGY